MGRVADLLIRIGTQDHATGSLRALESSVIRTVGSISAALAGIATLAFPVTQASAFELEMATTERTTGYTVSQIQRLSDSLVVLSTKLGTAAQDLAVASGIAGQLGVSDQGRKAMEAFIESTARASVTLGMTVETTANFGAQISAIFGKSIGDVERVYSALNEVAVDSVANASDLFDILKRVGTVSGVTFEQVTALAATMSQLGVPNEQAGTALVKFVGNMLAESEKFAKAMGLSQSDWVKKVNANALDALKGVLTKISAMEDAEGATLTKKLFGAGRLYSAASKLIEDAGKGFPILNRMLAAATKGYQEGTSSMDAYAKIMDTVSKQIDVLKASFVGLSLEAGEKALPALREAIAGLSEAFRDPTVIAYFGKIGEGIAGLVTSVANATSAIAHMNVEWGNVAKVVSTVASLTAAWFGIRLVAAIVRFALPWRIVGTAILWVGNIVAGLVGSRGFATLGAVVAGATAAAGAGIRSLAIRAALLPGAMGQAAMSVTAFGLRVGAVFAAIGGWPAAILAAVGAVWYFKDSILSAIGSMLGFETASAAATRRAAEAAARERAKARSEAIADAEDMNALLNKTMFNEDGSVQRKPRKIGYELTLDIKKFNEDLTQVIDDYGTAMQSVAMNDKAIAAATEDQKDLEARRIELLTKEWELKVKIRTEAEKLTAAARTAESTKEYRSSTRAVAREDTEESRANLEKYTAELQKVRTEASNVAIAIDQKSAAIVGYAENLKKQGAAAASMFGPEFMRRVDQDTLSYLRQTNAINILRAAQTELGRKVEEITRKRDKSENKEYSDKQMADLSKYRGELTSLRAEEDKLNAGRQNTFALLSTNQQRIATLFKNMDAGQVSRALAAIGNTAVKSGDAIERAIRPRLLNIITEHLRLERLSYTWNRLSDAANGFQKAAKSALDNTARELDALYSGFAKFSLELDRIVANREKEAASTENLGKVDHEYDVRRRKLERSWDERIRVAADGAEREYLEEQKYQALKLLDDEKTAASNRVKAQALSDRIAATYKEVQANIAAAQKLSGVEQNKDEVAKQNKIIELRRLYDAQLSAGMKTGVAAAEKDKRTAEQKQKALNDQLDLVRKIKDLGGTVEGTRDFIPTPAAKKDKSEADRIKEVNELIEKKTRLAELEAQPKVVGTKDRTAAQIDEEYQALGKRNAEMLRLRKEIADAERSVDPTKADLVMSTENIDAAKAKIKEMQKQVQDMAELMNGMSPSVDKAKLEAMKEQIKQAIASLSAAAPDVNQAVYDKATLLAQEIESAAQTFASQAATAADSLQLLKDTYVNADQMIKDAEGMFNAANITATTAADELSKAFGVGQLTVEAIAKGVTDIANAAALLQADIAKKELDTYGKEGMGKAATASVSKVVLKPEIDVKLSDADRARIESELANSEAKLPAELVITDFTPLTDQIREAYAAAGREPLRLPDALVPQFKADSILAANADVDTFSANNAELTKAFFVTVSAPSVLADNMSVKTLEVTDPVSLNITPSSFPAMAKEGSDFGPASGKRDGGPIIGPGTGISDSIPIWASNGEYMIDAITTGFFGSGFFRGLQAIARGGGTVRMPKAGLPALAGGGSVSGAAKVGSVDLNVGKEVFTLYGEAKRATEFVDALSRMRRR